MQLLIDHPIPSTAPLERAQLYTAYCTKLLQSLGTATIKLTSADETIDVVGEALTGMGRVLCSVGSVRLFLSTVTLVYESDLASRSCR